MSNGGRVVNPISEFERKRRLKDAQNKKKDLEKRKRAGEDVSSQLFMTEQVINILKMGRK